MVFATKHRVAMVALGALAAVGLPAVPAAAAPAAAPCGGSTPSPSAVIQNEPWLQQWMNPKRVWPFSMGAGVKVAVLDSGVDKSHQQLAGAVVDGRDQVTNSAGGTVDCVGHGTGVASIIGAQPADGIGFVGLAYGARIVPVRITDKAVNDADAEGAMVAHLAQGIRWAVTNGAKVLNISVATYRDDPALRDAVKFAVDNDAVVVAAAGNVHSNELPVDPTPYPAAYPGVVGVGAIDRDGVRGAQSQVGSYVDLVAPGYAITVATPRSGHTVLDGTSYAAPVVAAAAALVRSAEPELAAEEVVERLIATADPARGGSNSQEYGHGVVSLYRAVTERVSTGNPATIAPFPPVHRDPAAESWAAHWESTTVAALAVTTGVGLLTVAVVVAAWALPRGRRRRWRPARPSPEAVATPTASTDMPAAEPEDVFFSVPRRGQKQ